MDIDNRSKADVRGQTSLTRPGDVRLRLLSGLFDLSVLGLLYTAVIRGMKLSPIPSWGIFAGILVFWILTLFFQRRFFAASFGQSLWKLKRLKGKLIQYEMITPLKFLTSATLTASVFCVSLFLGHQTIFKHPVILTANELKLPVFIPKENDSKNWSLLPFFYILGAWPKKFDNKPILFSLPYEKGPPTRFAGHVISRWQMPNIRLVLEGPKSPVKRHGVQQIKECFTGNAFRCVAIRNEVILRHASEMDKAVTAAFWDLRWFEIENDVLPPTDRPRGFYLRAAGRDKIQERYVLITANGTHQAIILDRQADEFGKIASDLTKKIVGSLRVTTELNPGRALVDKTLSEVHMEKVNELEDSIAYVTHLAQVQAALISKISVQPKSSEAFYHLGGTAFMLLKHTGQIRTRNSSVISGQLALLVNEWAAVSKPLVRIALKYMQDVDPNSINTTRLENLWIEAKKSY